MTPANVWPSPHIPQPRRHTAGSRPSPADAFSLPRIIRLGLRTNQFTMVVPAAGLRPESRFEELTHWTSLVAAIAAAS